MAWLSACAHADVVERRLAVVHREDGLALGRADQHLEARVGLELRQVLGRRVVREGVDVAGHHRGEGGGRVGDELEGDLLERRRLAPVVVAADELDPVALHPVREGEGAGADRLLGVAVGGRRRDDHRVAPGEVGEQRALGRVEADLERDVVDRRHLVDAVEQPLLRVQRALGHRPVEGEDHVLGGERRAVLEGHARRAGGRPRRGRPARSPSSRPAPAAPRRPGRSGSGPRRRWRRPPRRSPRRRRRSGRGSAARAASRRRCRCAAPRPTRPRASVRPPVPASASSDSPRFRRPADRPARGPSPWRRRPCRRRRHIRRVGARGPVCRDRRRRSSCSRPIRSMCFWS